MKKENTKNKYKMNAKVTVEQAQNLKSQLDQQGIPLSTEYNDKKGTLVIADTDTETRKKIRSTLKSVVPPATPIDPNAKPKKLKQKNF